MTASLYYGDDDATPRQPETDLPERRDPDPQRYAKLAPRLEEGPLLLTSLLPKTKALELEIGFGRGASLFERANQVPEHGIVGIEVKAKCVVRVQERVRERNIRNIKVFCGDARTILRFSKPDGCLSLISLHFPDPWWKKKHAKRRVLDDELLSDMVRLLRVQGNLFVQTDVHERAQDYSRLLMAQPCLQAAGADPHGWVSSNPYDARSNRERRAELDGLPIYRLLFHKTKQKQKL